MSRPLSARGQSSAPLARLAPAALLLTLGAGCRGPSPEDWMSVGFETPAQTLRTFQTGLRGNEPNLEYDSFSAGFRARFELSEIAYRELRDRDDVFGAYPFLRKFVELEIVGERVEGPRERTLVVRLSALLAKRYVEVRFVRDDYYSVRSNEHVLADDYAAFGTMLASDGDRLVVVLPTELLIDPLEVTKVVVGQDWKIDGFRELTEEEFEEAPAVVDRP